MQRKKLLKHLACHGCLFLREGKRHSIFYNPKNKLVSTVPRHREIDNFLSVKICTDLGIEPVKK